LLINKELCISDSLAPSTQSSYMTGVCSLLQFTASLLLDPFPIDEYVLCLLSSSLRIVHLIRLKSIWLAFNIRMCCWGFLARFPTCLVYKNYFGVSSHY